MSLVKFVLAMATAVMLSSGPVYAANPPTARFNKTTGYHFRGGMALDRILMQQEISFRDRMKYGLLTFSLLWEGVDTVKPSGEGFDIIDLGSSMAGIFFDNLFSPLHVENFFGLKEVKIKPYGAVAPIPSYSRWSEHDTIPSNVGYVYGIQIQWGMPPSNIYKGPYRMDKHSQEIDKTN